MNHSIIKK